ncbi:MAG: hypothetical protein WAT39_03545 [Planctomycetota bacterium]
MNLTLPAVAVMLVTAAVAQEPAQEPGQPVGIPAQPFNGVFVADADDAGTTWVRGQRYKLAVGTGSVRFQPLFGPKAPRDYPVSFTLAAAGIGGALLPLGEGGEWHRREHTFTRERGAVRECWTVAAGGAQQWFQFDRAPGHGDLVVRIGVAAELELVDDGPGVRFVAPGLGDVRYSDAVAIDGNGRQLELPVVVQGAQLVVTVPAAFVATAAWPLVIDPLLTTVAIDTTVSNVQDPAVTGEPTTGNWLVVAEEHLSATDVDIVSWRYDNSAVPVLLDTVYADNTANFTHNPDVGFVAQTQRFIVAWHLAASGTGQTGFQFRNRAAGSATMSGTSTTSVGIGADPDNRPRIGSTLSGDRFLLVMFRKNVTGTDVFAGIWSSAGSNFGAVFVGPIAFPSQGTVVPGDVSTAASLADKWVVVWRECTSAGCSSQLVRMQAIVSNNGFSPLTGEPSLTLATETVADHVRVAGHSGNLLAVWRAFDAVTNGNDVHGVPIAISGGLYGPQGAAQNLSAQEPNCNETLEQFRPAVAYDGCRFVYGYLEDDGTDLLFPHAATVFVSGSTIAWHEGHLALSTVPGLSCRSFDVGYGAAAGTTFGHHFAAWQQDSPTFTGDARGALVDARQAGLTSIVSQTGCGLPTEPGISLSGTPALGRTFTITISTPGFPLLLAGLENISLLPGCNGCMAGIDLASMATFASTSLAVAVPCNPTLIQVRLAFQGMSILQPGGCPASFVGFDFALSDTITIQVL